MVVDSRQLSRHHLLIFRYCLEYYKNSFLSFSLPQTGLSLEPIFKDAILHHFSLGSLSVARRFGVVVGSDLEESSSTGDAVDHVDGS